MSRHLLTLWNDSDRKRAHQYVEQAPSGTRVEFKALKRSIDQNSKLWASLTDVSAQKDHNGRKYTPDQWKIIFLAAIGREIQFIPSLDGKTFLPWGQSSSDLSKKEMSDLIEFIQSWGAENQVTFHDRPTPPEPSQIDYAGTP